MNLFSEIERITELLYPKVNAAGQPQNRLVTAIDGGPECSSLDMTTGADPSAPITYDDLPLGSEFYDEDGNLWEKREKYAIYWIEGEEPVCVNFKPTDRVRLK